HITSATDSTTCGTLSNTASFGSGNAGSGNSGTATDITVNCGDLGQTKTADVNVTVGSIANAGDTVGYTITVTNTGAGDAHGVTIADDLPATGFLWQVDTANTTASSCAVTGTATTAQTLNCGPDELAALTGSVSVHITSAT